MYLNILLLFYDYCIVKNKYLQMFAPWTNNLSNTFIFIIVIQINMLISLNLFKSNQCTFKKIDVLCFQRLQNQNVGNLRPPNMGMIVPQFIHTQNQRQVNSLFLCLVLVSLLK